MADRSYYYLQRGDYLQSGDEFEDHRSDPPKWKLIDDSWIGYRWGYDPESGEPNDWAPVRRLVPENFRRPYAMSGPDLWGEEFELSTEEIRTWQQKKSKK